MQQEIEKAAALIEAMPHIQAFHDKIILVKLGGSAMDNEASIRLLNKLGFREEGIRRQYGYWKDEYHDVRSFALLKQDWCSSPLNAH